MTINQTDSEYNCCDSLECDAWRLPDIDIKIWVPLPGIRPFTAGASGIVHISLGRSSSIKPQVPYSETECWIFRCLSFVTRDHLFQYPQTNKLNQL
jgi:hypothetical protein